MVDGKLLRRIPVLHPRPEDPGNDGEVAHSDLNHSNLNEFVV